MKAEDHEIVGTHRSILALPKAGHNRRIHIRPILHRNSRRRRHFPTLEKTVLRPSVWEKGKRLLYNAVRCWDGAQLMLGMAHGSSFLDIRKGWPWRFRKKVQIGLAVSTSDIMNIVDGRCKNRTRLGGGGGGRKKKAKICSSAVRTVFVWDLEF